MPPEYSDHPLCRQLMILKDEESLKDVAVSFGESVRADRISGFLLSLLSPVWCARLCGEFSHRSERLVALEEDDAEALQAVVELGCGGKVSVMMQDGMAGLLEIGRFAERYQIEEVRRAVEEEAVRHLKLETCFEVQTVCETNGLRQIEAACRRMALECFEELTRMEVFMGMGEEMLRSLLEDDQLRCEMEEAVFEGLVRWMKGGGSSEVRGEGLLETIRFPLMREHYLVTSARMVLGGSERLEQLVSEALMLKGLPAEERSKHIKYLGGKALQERVGRGVWWEEYSEGRRDVRRLPDASSNDSFHLAQGDDWVCTGHRDGTITVWNKASLDVERTLQGHTEAVTALAACDGWLVSGSNDRDIRVWDARGGQCVRTLKGHFSWISALAGCERMLLSGSDDQTIRVWRLEGAPSTWRCERTIDVQHTYWDSESVTYEDDRCCCLAWWGSKGVSGFRSGAISVWDLSTGGCLRTMRESNGFVSALVVREGRLFSASLDKCVREWCLDSGECMKAVVVCPSGAPQMIHCLTMSGGKLVGGSVSSSDVYDCEVIVWDPDTLEEEHRLKQPAGQSVETLLASDGCVWGVVGTQVVVWRREG